MQIQSLTLALVGLAATVSAIANPAHPALAALAARADATACASSAFSIASSFPTPTDKALSSFYATQTQDTFTVPVDLQKPYCTYEASAAAWASSVAGPFLQACSMYIDAAERSSLTAQATTQTWCATVTKNVAMPRETGAMAIMAAAGLAVAIM